MQPISKNPKRKIPKYRPCHVAYSQGEINLLTAHQLYLDESGMIMQINKDDAESLLQFANWKRIQPGMWVKGLIGPMKTQEAKKRQDQEDSAWGQR